VRKFVLLLSVIVLLCRAADAYAFAEKGQNCFKCHTLKKDEAAKLVRNLDPTIKILSVNISPVKYLWQISIDFKGRKELVYIDLPKRHLFSGSIIDLQGRKNITQSSLSELNRVDPSRIPLKDAVVLGRKNTKHKVIVFDDPE
jgi:thiol:disulfide interchange protein DsbC